jgi:hypothetical protein
MSECNTGGWIKIHRTLTDHWLAEHPDKLGWWILLLLKVNHEDKKVLVGNNLIELKRGQAVASLTYLAELWNTSKRTAERFVELLEQDNMLSRCTRQKVTILTICNYDSYQDNNSNGCANVCANDEPIGIQSVSETKKEKERKEILDINTNAHTREEKISFDAAREQQFFNTFKGTGVGVSVARATGKKANEIFQLLDIFMAECQIRESGHKDFQDFKEHFLNAIKGDYISLPAQPQEQSKKKVITNEDLYKEMYGS